MISLDELARLARECIASLTDQLETEKRPAMRRSLIVRIKCLRETEKAAKR
jgi:hypothetical protein